MRFTPILTAAFVMLASASVQGGDVWDLSMSQALMRESGRLAGMTQAQFSEMQARKPAYLKKIETYLKESLGTVDQRVIKAFEEVPREYFMYNYERDRSLAQRTYESDPHPWPIGYGSYISDYRAQAYMTQLLQPKASDVCLEIGTGSGFQTAVLSRLVKEAYTIEIITALGEKVDKIYGPLGYTNVRARVGDGFYGWPNAGQKFDEIIVTCAAPFVPPALLAQLKNNGRMIIPIGQPYKTQFLYVFTKDANGQVHSRRDIPTYFIPMTGLAAE
jgi:protein-L-isoaspartate(D-aspartate) O-methyltransferase